MYPIKTQISLVFAVFSMCTPTAPLAKALTQTGRMPRPGRTFHFLSIVIMRLFYIVSSLDEHVRIQGEGAEAKSQTYRVS